MSLSTPTSTRRSFAKGVAWVSPAAAVVVTAPVFAASVNPRYGLATNFVYHFDYQPTFNCSSQITALTFSSASINPTDATLPAGFSVVNGPLMDDSGPSPTTTATLSTPWQLVLEVPAWLIDTRGPGYGLQYSVGQTDWSAPTLDYTTINGVSYAVFTFTWSGNPTQSTVPIATSGRMAAWVNSALAFDFTPAAVCINPNNMPLMYGGYRGDLTTENGYTSTFDSSSNWAIAPSH